MTLLRTLTLTLWLLLAGSCWGQDWKQSAVRLSAMDGGGRATSHGTGTVIHSKNDEALILTCGHLFRESGTGAPVEMDIYYPEPAQLSGGKVLYCDLASDVALVAIKLQGQKVGVAEVASFEVQAGDPVTSIGCGHGGAPVRKPSRVNALQRYVGPANTSVAGVPTEGRSGGGLFNQDGRVVGVCNAADPERGEGIYAGLGSIHTAIQKSGLSWVMAPADKAEAQQTQLRMRRQPICPDGSCDPRYIDNPPLRPVPSGPQPPAKPPVPSNPPPVGAAGCRCKGKCDPKARACACDPSKIAALELRICELEALLKSGKLKGEKGDAGPKGDKGEPGPVGPQGAAAKVVSAPVEIIRPDGTKKQLLWPLDGKHGLRLPLNNK